MVLAMLIAGGAGPAVAAMTTILDIGGIDQIDQGHGDQMDVTAFTRDGATFGVAFDETSLSGNNSLDACTYLRESDGTVTAICGSYANGVFTYEVLDCGTDYKGGKCTGNSPTSQEYTATCTLTDVPGFFTGDDNPDAYMQCTLTATSLATTPVTKLKYINTCSKASGSPSSLSNDCIFELDSPELRLLKVVSDGPAVATDFTLTATQSGGTGYVVSAAGDTGLVQVPAGSYTLTETAHRRTRWPHWSASPAPPRRPSPWAARSP